jgi:outer membrane lipoprotein LolB
VKRAGRAVALAALVALLALGACRSVPERATSPPSAAERGAVATLDAWRARGRVAIHTASEGFSASFDWRERGGVGEVDVRGPLGAGAAHITRSADLVRVDTGSGTPFEVAAPFASLDEELTARLGFSLPVTSLRYWLLGVPAPDVPSDAAGDGFSQSGWAVAPGAYLPVAGAPGALPGRLVLSRATTVIRIVVSDWQVGAP